MEFNLEEWLEYAKRVAKRFSISFEGIDSDDIYQELAILLITKEEQLTRNALSDSYIKKALQNVAYNYCMSERDSHFVFSGSYDYRTDDVRLMLEKYFAGMSAEMFVPDDAKTIESDDHLVINGDIARAVEQLSETELNTLEDGIFGDEPSTPAERKRYSRAVKKVTRILNENANDKAFGYEGPGARKVITNRKALGKTKMEVAA